MDIFTKDVWRDIRLLSYYAATIIAAVLLMFVVGFDPGSTIYIIGSFWLAGYLVKEFRKWRKERRPKLEYCAWCHFAWPLDEVKLDSETDRFMCLACADLLEFLDLLE